MSSYLNRRLESLKSNPRFSDTRAMKLLMQPPRTKAQAVRAERKKMIEKRVVNSLTELFDSKSQENYRNTLVFKILVKNIMKHLMESGKCTDEKACLATAKKMAAFVSDIMKETYRKQRPAQRISKSRTSISSLNRDDKTTSRFRSREPLSRIPEEKIKRIVRTVERKKETKAAPTVSKVEVKAKIRTPPPTARTATPKTISNKGDSSTVKPNKEKLNSWLSDVDSRTKKWTEWIRDTVQKAESSKIRVRSGESLKIVSDDWKKFARNKKEESRNLDRSYSNIWKGDNEAFRKRGEESIQQWVLKNRLNDSSKDFYHVSRVGSGYSVRTSSSGSIGSAWSSRAPSTISSGDSDLARFKQMGLFR